MFSLLWCMVKPLRLKEGWVRWILQSRRWNRFSKAGVSETVQNRICFQLRQKLPKAYSGEVRSFCLSIHGKGGKLYKRRSSNPTAKLVQIGTDGGAVFSIAIPAEPCGNVAKFLSLEVHARGCDYTCIISSIQTS